MKVRIENIVPDTAKVVSNPVWLIVDEKKDIVRLKDKNDKVVSTTTETSVRCNIGIIDYKSKKEALLIADIIKKALGDNKIK